MVTIIIDQLLTKGPVVSQITVYKDFPRIYNITDNSIYIYNGSAEYDGEHAIVITGYGYSEKENKYYWLIQNSWGKEWNVNGFIKVEFGQIGADRIAFSEPHNPQEDYNITNINVNSLYIDEECNLYIDTVNNTFKDMNNTLELTFQKKDTNEEFLYYCNILPGKKSFVDKQTLSCFVSIKKLLYNKKGKYELIKNTSLEKENNSILDELSLNKNFEYFGYPLIYRVFPFYSLYLISRKGSMISFWYESDEIEMTEIYPFKDAEKSLRDCNLVRLDDFYWDLIYCNIQEDELEYFKSDISINDSFLYTKGLCGYWNSLDTYVYRFKERNILYFL